MNTHNYQAFVAQVKQLWKNMSPNEHFEYSFMDEDFDAAYPSEQRTGKLFLSFTTLAVIIACLGLFSLAAYAAEQRNKEIGIRKILGAGVSTTVAMLSKDFIKLVFISIIIATPLAWLIMNNGCRDMPTGKIFSGGCCFRRAQVRLLLPLLPSVHNHSKPHGAILLRV
ncbi:ABC transporter permease [Mucilaginibacter lappiensis]|uniref:ABC-type antimicrobial peptide transport system permease subunit n=1 Tax=Mucilaginibacter lappiensis TaxID=354630 RepID=A0A841JHV2_9SPHI|nr:FtsX-like permease family protein [Mucilaginibacter lappiensis]MBB6128025.1 ABC-type antimicrobial peptide transport system permease subunit [Mucilaginibacter lappiensis]